MNGAVLLRRATAGDEPRLARLGPAPIREAFGGEFPAAEVDARMAMIYSRSQLRADLADPRQAWFLALASGRAVGFLALREGRAPGCVAGPRPVEIARVYVRAAWHGRGPAFALMDAGLVEAEARGAGVLWLQAWERNPKALAFYRAHGFRRVGEVPVKFGGRFLPHLVLVKSLAPAARP